MPRKDHRIEIDGILQDFTCMNYGYRTNVELGYPHGEFSPVKGSVFEKPLVAHGGYTLWLEYVIGNNGDEMYRLMWYQDGTPKIPMSGVLKKEDLCSMSLRLSKFCD